MEKTKETTERVKLDDFKAVEEYLGKLEIENLEGIHITAPSKGICGDTGWRVRVEWKEEVK